MKILVAADSFKDALSSAVVCKAIVTGLKEAIPAVEADPFPLADGGEGTVEILKEHLNGEEVTVEVEDPLGRPVRATYLLSADRKTAYVEMAQASGLPLLQEEERNPLHTSTFGTGQLIRHAVAERGARHIFLGIGGSATNDMGIGLAAALGYRFLDDNGQVLKPVGRNLEAIQRVDRTSRLPELDEVHCTVLCDVDNPLYGPKGAAHIYGPQKGASPEEVVSLDRGLRRLAGILAKEWDLDLAQTPGAGAAGGLGAGAMAFLDAELKPGIEAILQMTGFAERVKQYDYIFTGEGKIDGQSLHGKLIRGITRTAQRSEKPVIALCGRLDLSVEGIRELGLLAAFSISDGPMPLPDALRRTEELLVRTAFNVGRLLT